MAPIRCLSGALIYLLVGHVIVLVSVVGLRSSSENLQQRATRGLSEKRAAVGSGSWILRQLNAPAAAGGGKRLRHLQASSIQVGNTSVSEECILLFGAFCNGENRFTVARENMTRGLLLPLSRNSLHMHSRIHTRGRQRLRWLRDLPKLVTFIRSVTGGCSEV